MPKRGLDVNVCEVFRFYRLIAIKDLVEPLSMIVPRKEVYFTFYSSSCCIYTGQKVRGTDLLCPSSQVFSKRICTRWQLETRQPWRLRSGCLGSTEVGDELRWMTDACISFSQWSTRLSVSVRPCAYVHEAWDSSSQPVPRNPCWEGACEAVELPEIRDGSSWWCRDQDRS